MWLLKTACCLDLAAVSILIKHFLLSPVIVVLTNKEDSVALVLEAERQGLMNGDYVFFLVQNFEVTGSMVGKTFTTNILHIFHNSSHIFW